MSEFGTVTEVRMPNMLVAGLLPHLARGVG
jgi:hypothetical protein